MPSAAAKIEKQSSLEGQDSLKSIITIFEKKTRNLEKRKGKLDNLKKELEQGKELNEDQKAAVGKYDQVLETLELTRELQKSVTTVMQDHLKQSKRLARKEQLERQQRELQRMRELLEVQDVLATLGAPEARQSFLEGSGGAVALSEEALDRLDQLYRLVCPDREEAGGQFGQQVSAAADHVMALLDARPKAVLDTTYKALREMLQEIQGCAYFAGSAGADESSAGPGKEAAEAEEEEEEEEEDRQHRTAEAGEAEKVHQPDQDAYPSEAGVPPAAEAVQVAAEEASLPPNQPELPPVPVLPPGGAHLDFLQESQIDLESPHMDPAVVAAHPMAAPPAGFVLPVADYDLARPIPTQTFTNQSFSGPPQAPVAAVAEPCVQRDFAGNQLGSEGPRRGGRRGGGGPPRMPRSNGYTNGKGGQWQSNGGSPGHDRPEGNRPRPAGPPRAAGRGPGRGGMNQAGRAPRGSGIASYAK
ncbi:unnamed protein product [Ixodes pacificus]